MNKIDVIKVIRRGVMPIGDSSIECAVTADERRVLNFNQLHKLLGYTGNYYSGASGGSFKWPSYLTGNAVKDHLAPVIEAPLNRPFWVVDPNGHGVAARSLAVPCEILPRILHAFIRARVEGRLRKSQHHIADRCMTLLEALGEHAMRDLVDKATGYNVAHVPEPAPAFPLPKTYAEALRMLADTVEESEAKDKRLAVAEPRAAAWNVLADPRREGDFDVGTAAKILDRDPSISIGRNRLFKWMLEHGMTYKANNGRRENYLPYQKHVDAGRLVMRIGSPWKNPKTGAIEVGEPQLRITVKGLGYIHRELGGTAPLDMSGGPEEPPTPPALQ